MSASSDSYCATYKRLRPLIPKPAAPGSLSDLLQPTYSSIAAAADLLGDQLNPDLNAQMDRQNISYDFKHIQNHSKLLRSAGQYPRSCGITGIGNCSASSQTVTSRWNPTADQLRILEDLYKRGIRTPSAEQIQYITAQLRCYGKIEGKNVFYWFQNHKARERQKRRRRLMEMSAAGLLPLRIDSPQPWEKLSKQQDSCENVARWSGTNMEMKMTRLPPRPRNTFTEEEPAAVENFLKLATPSAHEHEECKTVQVNYLRSISQHKRCNSGRRGVSNPNPTEQHERSTRENCVIEKAYIGPQKSKCMQWPLGTAAKNEAADRAEMSNKVLIDEKQGEFGFLHQVRASPESRTSKPNQLITLELFPLYSESTTDYNNSIHCENTLSMSSEAEGAYNFLSDLKSKCDGMKIHEDRSDQEEEEISHCTACFHEFLPLHSN